MSTVRPIEIFRPGRHTAMSGETLVFGEADLRASAEAYDPSRHEAPIVIGHPRHDAPAYGWIASLSYADGRLLAHPRQGDPEFAELVRNGRFKKVSAFFYKPDSPSNPVPGVYYLRHVGFLGAQPPAVKGLKAVELAAGDEDVVEVEFGEADGGIVRDLFRRLREWLIRSAGQETADDVVPAWMVDSVERQLEEAKDSPSYSEPTGSVSQQREETDVDPKELEKRERELAERQRELEAREAEFAEREQQIQAAARGRGAVARPGPPGRRRPPGRARARARPGARPCAVAASGPGTGPRRGSSARVRRRWRGRRASLRAGCAAGGAARSAPATAPR